MALTVDEVVETRVLPQYRPIVAAFRALMKEAAPDATELIGYDQVGRRQCRRRLL